MLRRQRDLFEATDEPLTGAEFTALKRQITSPLLQRCLRTIDLLQDQVVSLQQRGSASNPKETRNRANR
jgi:hypothetical protein